MSSVSSIRTKLRDVQPVDSSVALFAAIADFRPSPWCGSLAKRALDFTVACFLLLCALPLFPIVALLIKLTSPGPALFVHDRVGRNGKTFRMYKFRSMEYRQQSAGAVLTRDGDLRITTVGRYIRKWKLDELPQLFHVVRGDLSLIGPRPHIPRLLGNHPELGLFLSLRPGVTGLATMLFRHEESTLPNLPVDQLEAYYIENVLPEKIRLELLYAQNSTFWTDVLILARTLQQICSRNHTGEAAMLTSKKILARPRLNLLIPRTRSFGLVGWISVFVLGLTALLWTATATVRSASRKEVAAHSVSGSSEAPQRFSAIFSWIANVTGWSGFPFHSSPLAKSEISRDAGDPRASVWIDLSTGLYYCPGSKMYGQTRRGWFDTQRDAQMQHFESALRRPCGGTP